MRPMRKKAMAKAPPREAHNAMTVVWLFPPGGGVVTILDVGDTALYGGSTGGDWL